MNLASLGALVGQREERRQTQEACVWCNPETMSFCRGIILNESASGVLLKGSPQQDIGKTVYILPEVIGDFSYEHSSSAVILNHPMSRVGTVMRHESTDLMGIRFEIDENRPQYRRWFRGKSTITTLSLPYRCAVTLSGELSLEAGSVVQSFLTQQAKGKEVLITTKDVTAVTPTSLTLLRSTIRKSLTTCSAITMVTGSALSPTGSMASSLPNETNLFLCQEFAQPEAPRVITGGAAVTGSSEMEAKQCSVLVISPSLTNQNRYSQPLEKMDFHVVKEKMFEDAVKRILEISPEFIIVDFELEYCSQILKLNEVKKYGYKHDPPLLILGPNYIEPLVRASLRLPVKAYVSKPFTDRDYTSHLQTMLMSLPKQILERHMRSNTIGAARK